MESYEYKCDKCKRKIKDFSFRCRYCGKYYCDRHRLPEDHNCNELKEYKSHNQERWINVITSEHTSKPSKYTPKQKDMPPSNKLSSQAKIISKQSRKPLKFIRKNIRIITFLLILIIVLIYFGVIPIPFVKECEDETWYNHCSNTKPLYCNQGELINNATKCGCSYGYREKLDICEKIPTCEDGTFYSECGNKPMYCSNGVLISKASICGCPRDTVQQGEKCVDKYEVNPKNISLYGIGKFVVYGGLNDYLASLDRSITYSYVEPTTKDFILKDLDNDIQRKYLILLIDKIKSKSVNPDEQARIAIRMVQEIPYDTKAAETNSVTGRYAYEVLYDMKGVCMEKADLMAFLLRELGFGVAIFEFDQESHRAVGIRCENGNYNTNYCFIEATDVYPVGKIPIEYVGGVDIRGATPELVIISEGYLFG